MGSTNFTPHYDIPLPLGSDKTTPMDYNTSMQAVDTALFTAQGDASDAKTGLATTNQNVAQNAEDISALAGRVTTVEGTVSSQGTAITNLGTKVDGVEQDAQDMTCAYNQASATASRNYAVDDYFIYNDVLYKATQTIASGATIVPDTNCSTTNVTSEIKSQASDIAQLNSDKANKSDFNIVDVSSHFRSSLTAFSAVAKKCGNIITVEITFTGTISAGNHELLWAVDEGYRPVVNFELGFSPLGSAADTANFVGANITTGGNGNVWFLNAVSGAKLSGTYICN